MGKHNDRRGSRRRDFDDDGSASDGRSAEPSYFQRPSMTTAPSVEAEVLWFNAEKGFGFVKTTDGAEAFLHVRALEAAGRTSVAEGTWLTVRIEQGQKGKQVAEVVEIGVAPARELVVKPATRSVLRAPGTDRAETEIRGTVKWYNLEKGFGFIGPDDGGKDIFVHVTALTRSGIAALTEGQAVTVVYAQGQKGPEARSVAVTS
jgi:CspA family cold shock protein